MGSPREGVVGEMAVGLILAFRYLTLVASPYSG